MMTRALIYLGVALTLYLAPPVVGQDCGLLADLPPQDIDVEESDVEFARKTEAWLSSSQFVETGSDQSLGANMLVPIQGLVVQLGYKWDKSGRSKFVREFRSRWESDAEFRRRFRAARISLNQGLVSALRDCLTQKGLHAWIEPGGAPEQFIFHTQFNSPGEPPFATVRNLQKSRNVTCDAELVPGDSITGAGRGLLCYRSDSAGVTLVLNANVGTVSGPLTLPPIPPADPCAACLHAPRPNHPYRIRVFTSDRPNAGTDANVYITLFGSVGTLRERRYDLPGVDDNRRGSSDSHQTPVTRDLGEICRIRIRHDNSGTNPGWHVARLVVDDYNGHSWTFPVDRWLARNMADKKIELTVRANPSRC